MAQKKSNLIPGGHKLTLEEQSAGGKASGEARRLKKTMREMLKECLEMKDNEGRSYQELATVGLLKGAMVGNAQNYKAIVEMLGELDPEQPQATPTLKIEVVDNEKLEKVLYEDK